MENNYRYQINGIKKKMLGDIAELLGKDGTHDFSNAVQIHCVGEGVLTLACHSVETSDGTVKLHTEGASGETTIEGDEILLFDTSSIIGILYTLRNEIKGEKVYTLMEIVRKAGGFMHFDGNFDFYITDGADDYVCTLKSLEVKAERLIVTNVCDGDLYTNYGCELSMKGIDKLISYVSEEERRISENEGTLKKGNLTEIKSKYIVVGTSDIKDWTEGSPFVIALDTEKDFEENGMSYDNYNDMNVGEVRDSFSMENGIMVIRIK